MRILAVNWQDLTNPLSGGAEVHLEELLRRVARKGHDVTLFCSSYRGALPEETIAGIHIIRRGNRYNFNMIAPWKLRRLTALKKYDVLIEDINKIPFYTPLYLDLPTLVVVPHLFSTTVFREINFLLGMYIYLSEKPLVRIYRGKKFNVISESTAQDIIARGIPREDVSVIHCGIDRSTYIYDPETRKFDKPTILYLGRIKKYKSINHLILAFKRVLPEVPGARLLIVGGGDYLGPLENLSRREGLQDRIEFPGFVSHEKKVEYLRRSHVAVYPSLKEGWGLTNIEANACGTCAVAADVPGLRDSVRDGVTGYLYRYGDIEDLAQKLTAILTDDAERKKLEEGAKEWAAEFNWDNAAAEFLEVLTEVAREK